MTFSQTSAFALGLVTSRVSSASPAVFSFSLWQDTQYLSNVARAETAPVPGPRQAPAAEPEPIDLLELAGGGQLKKYGAVALAVLAVLVLIWVLRRRR